jgi:hypothetical protein
MSSSIELEAQCQRGMIGESLLPRSVQVLAASQAGRNIGPEVGIVIEVADSSAADPAMRMRRPIGTKLMCGAEAEAGELVVELVLIREEAWQCWLVVPSDRVVVAQHEQAIAIGSRQRLKAREERIDEALLASDLLGTTIARRDVDTQKSELRLGVDDDATRTRRHADRNRLKFPGNGQSRSEEHTALTPFVTREGEVAVALEAGTNQLSTEAAIGLAEDDQVIIAAAQPAQDPRRASLSGDPDVEGDNAQFLGSAWSTRGAVTAVSATGRRSGKAGGRHRLETNKGGCEQVAAQFDVFASAPPLTGAR